MRKLNIPQATGGETGGSQTTSQTTRAKPPGAQHQTSGQTMVSTHHTRTITTHVSPVTVTTLQGCQI